MRCATRAREVVVVAHLDLVHRHRVVLVDDRQHPEVEQGEQRVAGVEVARAIADVLAGEQHLAHRDPVLLERLLVLPHQRGLPDRGRRLLLRDRLGPPLEAEARHPGGDGARRTPARPRACPGRARRDRRPARAMRSLDGPSPGVVTSPLPTFTTTRRARLSARRRIHGSLARRRAISWTSAGRPSPVTAEIGVKGADRAAAQKRSTAARAASVPGSSTLLTVTICGRAASSSE